MSSKELSQMARRLGSLLEMSKPAVAIAFDPSDAELAALERSSDSVPSSCSFWTKALDRAFYTTPAQHQSCSVGAVTHGYRPVVDARTGCGCDDIDLMVRVGWVTEENLKGLPSIPMNKERKIAYAPLAQCPFDPDVVLLFASSKQAMMIMEAAALPTSWSSVVTGKPACQGLPLSLDGKIVVGLGCTASRIRAGYSDNEIVVTIPAKGLEGFITRLESVAKADSAMVEALS